jgi:hypothetical protein
VVAAVSLKGSVSPKETASRVDRMSTQCHARVMSEIDGCVVLRDERCKVVIHPVRHTWPDASGFEDEIELVGGPFQGSISAVAYLDPYPHFHQELIKLYQTLSGNATLGGYENFEMTLTGDGLGHIQARVSAVAVHHLGIRLNFIMEFDQTQLPPIISAIKETFLQGLAR